MGERRNRSARERRSDPPGERRGSPALPASAARSPGRVCPEAVRHRRAAAAFVRTYRPAGGEPADLVPQHPHQATRQVITKPAELLQALDLDPQLLAGSNAANEAFALRVPASYLARIRRGDPHDPLLRQVLPLAEELEEQPGYVPDPLDERAAKLA